jgi:hypothetical protein
VKSLTVSFLALVGTVCLQAQQKPRVYVGESNSWEVRGSGGAWANKNNAGAWSSTAGGARGQTAEILKTVTERCPGVVVNNNPDMADYAIRFDHEGGKGWIQRRNKIAVFNRIGDSIFADSTRSLGNSIKDACAVIVKDWQAHAATSQPPNPAPERQQEKNEAIPLQPVAAAPSATIEVERKPIETPATRLIASTRPVEVAPSPREPVAVNSPNVSENPSPASMGIRCDEKPRIRHDGVLISAMMPRGPADEAGIREGDWLLALDDHYIYTVEELAAILHSHKPGDKVNVRYRRYATIYVTYVIMAGQSL